VNGWCGDLCAMIFEDGDGDGEPFGGDTHGEGDGEDTGPDADGDCSSGRGAGAPWFTPPVCRSLLTFLNKE
jgi:hypothetical protein